jgi:hypothetical protein
MNWPLPILRDIGDVVGYRGREERYLDCLRNCELMRLKLAPVSIKTETRMLSGRTACTKHALGYARNLIVATDEVGMAGWGGKHGVFIVELCTNGEVDDGTK